MKQFFRFVVLVVALFFVIGGFFAWRGTLDSNAYIIITGIVGSIASIVGLIALSGARLTAADVRNVDAELFQTLADQARAAKEYEEKLASNREELTKLERDRAEVELLVPEPA